VKASQAWNFLCLTAAWVGQINYIKHRNLICPTKSQAPLEMNESENVSIGGSPRAWWLIVLNGNQPQGIGQIIPTLLALLTPCCQPAKLMKGAWTVLLWIFSPWPDNDWATLIICEYYRGNGRYFRVHQLCSRLNKS